MNKKIILLALLLIGNLMPLLSVAADPVTPAATPATTTPAAPAAAANFDCKILNNHDILVKKATPATTDTSPSKDQQIVIINEERLPIDVSNSKNVKNCYRKISKTESGITVEYTNPGDCLAGDSIKCEPVQAFYGTVGTNFLYSYIGLMYRFIASVGGVLSVLIIIVGGIQVAAAGADSDKLNKAKKLISKSLTGLVLLLLSSIILYVINPNFFTT